MCPSLLTLGNGYHVSGFGLLSLELPWDVQAASTTSAPGSSSIYPCPFWYPVKETAPYDPASLASRGQLWCLKPLQ